MYKFGQVVKLKMPQPKPRPQPPRIDVAAVAEANRLAQSPSPAPPAKLPSDLEKLAQDYVWEEGRLSDVPALKDFIAWVKKR